MIYHIIAKAEGQEVYQLQERIGPLPSSFICYAPESEQERQEIIDDLASGSQVVIAAYVEENI